MIMLLESVREEGVVANVKHAAIFMPKEEKLWNTGSIGIQSPKALVRAVYLCW